MLTLVDLLEDANVTWKGYFEGLPGPGYAGQGSTSQDGSWDYVRKHKYVCGAFVHSRPLKAVSNCPQSLHILQLDQPPR